MKKIFSVIALCLFGAASVFAASRDDDDSSSSRRGGDGGEESVIHSFGMSLPTYERQTWGDMSDDGYHKDGEYLTTGLAFNVFYNKTTIAPNRFSKLRIIEFGYEGFDTDALCFEETVAKDASFSTFNSKFTFGWGGAPIVNDRVSFTVHGVFGFGTAIGGGEMTRYGIADSSLISWKNDGIFWNLNTFLGANAQCSVRLTDHFGLFAGTKMYINLIGFGIAGCYETDVSYNGKTYKEDSEMVGCVIYPGQFNIDFRIGVSLMY